VVGEVLAFDPGEPSMSHSTIQCDLRSRLPVWTGFVPRVQP
jgi:hypothetical protein